MNLGISAMNEYTDVLKKIALNVSFPAIKIPAS